MKTERKIFQLLSPLAGCGSKMLGKSTYLGSREEGRFSVAPSSRERPLQTNPARGRKSWRQDAACPWKNADQRSPSGGGMRRQEGCCC